MIQSIIINSLTSENETVSCEVYFPDFIAKVFELVYDEISDFDTDITIIAHRSHEITEAVKTVLNRFADRIYQ